MEIKGSAMPEGSMSQTPNPGRADPEAFLQWMTTAMENSKGQAAADQLADAAEQDKTEASWESAVGLAIMGPETPFMKSSGNRTQPPVSTGKSETEGPMGGKTEATKVDPLEHPIVSVVDRSGSQSTKGDNWKQWAALDPMNVGPSATLESGSDISETSREATRQTASATSDNPNANTSGNMDKETFIQTLRKLSQLQESKEATPVDATGVKGTESSVMKKEIPTDMKRVDMEANYAKVQDAIIKEVSTTRTGGQTTLKVQLEPENLGKVELDLTMERGILTAKIHVENDQVKALFRENLGHLQQVLQRQDLQMNSIQLELIPSSSAEASDMGRQGNHRQDLKRPAFGKGRTASSAPINFMQGNQTGETRLNILA